MSVTAQGRIGAEAQTHLNVTNRMLRVSLGVTDELSSVQVPGVSLALYDDADNLVTAWTTTSSALQLEDLNEGRYYLVKTEEPEKHYPFTVRNTKDVQVFNVHTTYVLQYVVLGAAALAIIGGVALVLILRRRKKSKTT